MLDLRFRKNVVTNCPKFGKLYQKIKIIPKNFNCLKNSSLFWNNNTGYYEAKMLKIVSKIFCPKKKKYQKIEVVLKYKIFHKIFYNFCFYKSA